MKTDCSSCLCPPARAPDWLPGMSPLIPGRSGTSPAASGMSPLVGNIPGLWRGGIPDRLGDIPDAARDIPGGRGYPRRGVGDIRVAGISPIFFGNVPAQPGISPGDPGMSSGTGSPKFLNFLNS